MDKNMISIDDLVKQRLSGGEEKERTEAWLQMRELLDKEMPEQVSGPGFNWRRTLGFVAGFLILASASIGGYKAITSFRNTADKKSNSTTAIAMNGYTGKSSTSSNSSITSNTQAANAQKTAITGNTANSNNTPAADHSNAQGNHRSTHAVAASGHIKGRAQTSATTKQQAANTQPASTNTYTRNTGNHTQPEPENRSNNNANLLVNNNKNNSTVTETSNKKENNSTNSISNNTLSQPDKTANKPVTTGTASTANGKNEAPVDANKFASGNTPSANNNQTGKPAIQDKPGSNTAKQANTSSNTLAKTTNNSNKPANDNKASGSNEIAKGGNANKKLIDKIETKETYDHRRGEWKKDTIDKGKVEWSDKEENALAINGKQIQTVNNEIVPASSVTSNSNKNEEKMLPLADFRVSSKKSNYQTSNFFEEMVKNAKMQLGNVKFYPGILLGVNYAMNAGHSMPGFQFGATGSLSLNEKWGIVAELKYLNSMNGSRISNRNDYMTGFQTIKDQNTGITTYSWDSVEHYFTYATVQSIQMPFMVRYSAKRLNVMMGANLAYSFIPSPNETSNTYEVKNMPNTNNYRPTTGAILDPLDFSSRFGIGYLFGIGYQLSPAIQLDGRLTQQVWDNAKTPGAERVSREVYRMPSLQLNLSYRFSSNKYKPYRQHQ